ncbi:MAG TPA: glutamyl-tRNA reductase [Saprospiraceae bacterium]|nr:glutamyl-tRNA reductase [Saprospiraceae bacterium]
MISDYKILTITHHDLNVDEIRYFVIQNNGKEELTEKLKDLAHHFEIDELVYLSTCNRITFLMYRQKSWTRDQIKLFFKAVNPGLSHDHQEALHRFVRVYEGEEAVRHIFEVASSIDSMVVGEREIFKQYKVAFQNSKEIGLTGDNLRLLDKYTTASAKQVYSNSRIGEKPLSITYLAMLRLMEFYPNTSSRIVMVGAGETNQLMARFLKKKGYTQAVVFNRSLDNAREITKIFDAPAYHLSELHAYDQGFDILITTTGSTSSIIDIGIYQSLLNKETSKKLIIDLSVPRNVDDEVVNTFPLQYVGIEELRTLAEANLSFRKNEVSKARELIMEKLKQFIQVYQQRKMEIAMQRVPEEIRAVKEKALNSVFGKELSEMDAASQSVIFQMMDYMERKCISIPMKLARKSVVSE